MFRSAIIDFRNSHDDASVPHVCRIQQTWARWTLKFVIALSLTFALAVAAQAPPATTVDPPPPEVEAAVTHALGVGATVLRYGHLGTPDSLEVVGAVPAPGIAATRDGVAVSRLTLLRQQGPEWVNAVTVNRGIRNNDGDIGGPRAVSALYRVSFFQHVFDDGRQRWVMQLTPIDQSGERIGPPVHLSWNEILDRYQQISLQGYGFQPEVHGDVTP
jgi:hypothetical protein